MQPRLRLDIEWGDLLSVFRPVGPDAVAQTLSLSKELYIGYSVRTLFDAILNSLSLPAGERVVFSAVNIESMFAIARGHGLVPYPVDIEFDTLLPSPAALDLALKTSRAKVVVIAQLCITLIRQNKTHHCSGPRWPVGYVGSNCVKSEHKRSDGG